MYTYIYIHISIFIYSIHIYIYISYIYIIYTYLEGLSIGWSVRPCIIPTVANLLFHWMFLYPTIIQQGGMCNFNI